MKNLSKEFVKINQEGFTLIELLIVIVIISALAVTVFTTLNPIKRIKDAHDSRRATDVETILSAIHSYIADNSGSLPAALATAASNPANTYVIGTCATCNTQAGLITGTNNYSPAAGTIGFQCAAVNNVQVAPINSGTLQTQLASYLKQLPNDPLYSAGGTTTWNSTGYAINIAAGNIITISACFPEDIATGLSDIQQSR